MNLTLKDIIPDINSENFEVEYDEEIASLLEPNFSEIVEKISIRELLNRFGIDIDCEENILKLTFLDYFTDYDKDKLNRHRLYGQDESALYEILIDENDEHNFLEYHMTCFDHSPSLIYI